MLQASQVCLSYLISLCCYGICYLLCHTSLLRSEIRYCPKKVCKLQSSYICSELKNQRKNNEAYKRTKIGINF